jgi:hemoglobin
MDNRVGVTRRAACALVIAALVGSSAAAQPAVEATLYQRLGGLDGIAALVDQLVDRMAADETLQANPYIHEAMGRVGKPGLKYRVVTMLCASAGGPEAYRGRSMHDAHAHLRITGREWRAFTALLAATFEALVIAEPERAGVLAIVDPAGGEIVVAGELDGQSFSGQRGDSGGESGAPDEVSFANGHLLSRADEAAGGRRGVYAAVVKEQATSFEAETTGPDGARVVWQGKVRGGTIEATLVSSKADGAARKGWFRGRAAAAP